MYARAVQARSRRKSGFKTLQAAVLTILCEQRWARGRMRWTPSPYQRCPPHRVTVAIATAANDVPLHSQRGKQQEAAAVSVVGVAWEIEELAMVLQPQRHVVSVGDAEMLTKLQIAPVSLNASNFPFPTNRRIQLISAT